MLSLHVSAPHILVIFSLHPEVNALALENSTESISGLSIFNFGNGLIEIVALTSLIGSTAAQSLAIGDKGPAGLAWATMTIFGAKALSIEVVTRPQKQWNVRYKS
jgi:hypothetical protein